MSRADFKSERHVALAKVFPTESPYRRHAQAYRPAPARRINLWRRLLRALIGALT